MKNLLIHNYGQTCNNFFIYSKYLADCIEKEKKLIILAPDISIKDYPNFIKSKSILLPFYNTKISNLIGYELNIKILHFFFSTKYSIYFLTLFFKLIPIIKVIEYKSMLKYKTKNRIKHKDKLIDVFTPDYKITKEVDSLFNSYRNKDTIIVGVHIRRGDYKTFKSGKYYYSLKQYHSFILTTKELFPTKKILFFISSNENIDFSIFTGCNLFYIDESTAIKDLYGLSICNYIIGPPSTFSGWASFYGKIPLHHINNPNSQIYLNDFKNILELWK